MSHPGRRQNLSFPAFHAGLPTSVCWQEKLLGNWFTGTTNKVNQFHSRLYIDLRNWVIRTPSEVRRTPPSCWKPTVQFAFRVVCNRLPLSRNVLIRHLSYLSWWRLGPAQGGDWGGTALTKKDGKRRECRNDRTQMSELMITSASE